MKIYLICPVRKATPEYSQAARQYVAQLESFEHQVYWPTRNTGQIDPTGPRICKDNRSGIEAAEEVHIIWIFPTHPRVFNSVEGKIPSQGIAGLVRLNELE